jgi:hypothetical protein
VPKTFSSYLQSRELAGLCCGLALAAVSPDWKGWLTNPSLGLLSLTLVVMLAGFWAAGAIVRAGHPMDIAVRRGTGAGALALLVAGTFFLWGMREAVGFSWVRAGMIFGASALPSLLAGSIAAGLGAVCFRRRVVPLPKLVELPKPFRWAVRGLIGLGFLSGLVAPWMPRPTPKVAVMAVRPEPEIRPAPVPTPTPPRRQFEYNTPADLLTAAPVAWKVKTSRDLGAMSPERGVAFSKDQRFLAWGESNSTIVVHDLESEDVRRISGIPYPVRDMAFSPDGERLFVIMQGQPLRVGVGFLKDRRFVLLPQPKKLSVPEGSVSWWKEKEVVFVPPGGPIRVLNLDTLVVDSKGLAPTELAEIKRDQTIDFPANDRWAFGKGSVLTFAERPEVEGTREWTW